MADWADEKAKVVMSNFAGLCCCGVVDAAHVDLVAAALRAAYARGKHDQRISDMDRAKLGDNSLALLAKTHPQAASEIDHLRREVMRLTPNPNAVGAIVISDDLQRGYMLGMEEAAHMVNEMVEVAYINHGLSGASMEKLRDEIRAKAGGGE